MPSRAASPTQLAGPLGALSTASSICLLKTLAITYTLIAIECILTRIGVAASATKSLKEKLS